MRAGLIALYLVLLQFSCDISLFLLHFQLCMIALGRVTTRSSRDFTVLLVVHRGVRAYLTVRARARGHPRSPVPAAVLALRMVAGMRTRWHLPPLLQCVLGRVFGGALVGATSSRDPSSI